MKDEVIIIHNMAKCLICGEVVESMHRHNYVTCSCGNLSVDGGKDYLKRCIVKGQDTYEELSTTKEVQDGKNISNNR